MLRWLESARHAGLGRTQGLEDGWWEWPIVQLLVWRPLERGGTHWVTVRPSDPTPSCAPKSGDSSRPRKNRMRGCNSAIHDGGGARNGASVCPSAGGGINCVVRPPAGLLLGHEKEWSPDAHCDVDKTLTARRSAGDARQGGHTLRFHFCAIPEQTHPQGQRGGSRLPGSWGKWECPPLASIR